MGCEDGKVEGTALGLCHLAAFGISCIELSGFATIMLVFIYSFIRISDAEFVKHRRSKVTYCVIILLAVTFTALNVSCLLQTASQPAVLAL
jgi:hypothetical protein